MDINVGRLCVSVCSLALPTAGAWEQDTAKKTSTFSLPILACNVQSLLKGNSSLGKKLISEFGQRQYNIHLEHLVPESVEMLLMYYNLFNTKPQVNRDLSKWVPKWKVWQMGCLDTSKYCPMKYLQRGEWVTFEWRNLADTTLSKWSKWASLVMASIRTVTWYNEKHLCISAMDARPESDYEEAA